MKTIILTSPHSYCTNTSYISHMCDFLAEKALTILQEKISNFEFIYVHKSNIDRRIIDLNRPISRNTRYRLSVDRILEKSDKHTTVLLDIHSFPIGNFDNSEIAILWIHDSSFADNLEQYLNNHGIYSQKFLGSKINDIMYSAIQEGFQNSLLLEFNESLSNSRLDYICSVIANFVYTM